jgi:hypothetical protein
VSLQLRIDRTWIVVGVVVAVVLFTGGMSLAVYGLPERVPDADGAAALDAAPPVGDATALVRLDAGPAAHPAARQVLELLERHFDAINRKDYATWAATVTGRRAAHETPAHWLAAFGSTRDDAVVVTGITATAGGVLVDLSFVSEQDPADAPADLRVGRICWSSHWPIEGVGAGGRIAAPAKGATSQRACP